MHSTRLSRHRRFIESENFNKTTNERFDYIFDDNIGTQKQQTFDIFAQISSLSHSMAMILDFVVNSWLTTTKKMKIHQNFPPVRKGEHDRDDAKTWKNEHAAENSRTKMWKISNVVVHMETRGEREQDFPSIILIHSENFTIFHLIE